MIASPLPRCVQPSGALRIRLCRSRISLDKAASLAVPVLVWLRLGMIVLPDDLGAQERFSTADKWTFGGHVCCFW